MYQLLHFSSENALHEGFLNHLYEHGFTALALCDEERNVAALTNLGHHEVHRAHSGIQTARTITAAVAASCHPCADFSLRPAADRPLPPSAHSSMLNIGSGCATHCSSNSVRFVVFFLRAIRVSPLHDDFFDNYHFTGALMACLFSVCFCELNYTLSEYDSAFVTLQSCRLPSLNCIDRVN